MKSFYIIHSSHPCTELILDVNQVRSYLLAAGLFETGSLPDADLVIVTTCAFNREYEDDAAGAIGRALASKKPGARVIASGCLSKISPERLAGFEGVESLAPSETEKIESIVPSGSKIADFTAHTVGVEEYSNNRMFMTGIRLKSFFEKLSAILPFASVPSWLDTVPMPGWYFIRGGSGCAGNCSYCAIKRSRGDIRSVPPEKIISEVEAAARSGYREISFAGDDMGCYGQDRGTDLAELLAEVVRVKGDFSVNIRFIEPVWLIRLLSKLEPVFRTGRIRSFCAPLQSGSQRILDLMNRRYRISDAVAAINHTLGHTRVRSISSIVMVGFPTETAEDFARSYELIDRAGVNFYQVLKYEGREGTKSEAMDGKVPENIKELRRERFAKKMKLTKIAGMPGTIAEKIVRARMGTIS